MMESPWGQGKAKQRDITVIMWSPASNVVPVIMDGTKGSVWVFFPHANFKLAGAALLWGGPAQQEASVVFKIKKD